MIKRSYFVSADYLDDKFNSKFYNSIFWTRSWFPCVTLDVLLNEVQEQTKASREHIKILSFCKI